LDRKRITILASGRGSDYQAIFDHVKLGILENVEIACLVCNHPGAPVCDRARQGAIDVVEIEGVSGKRFSSPSEREAARIEFDRHCLQELKRRQIDLIALAGFDQLLTELFVDQYPSRVMNIHPAYDLERFGGRNMVGLKVHEAVVRSGVRFSGCTVHIVTNGVDEGPPVLKKKVLVKRDDTAESLAARILLCEHLAYPEAIQLFVDGRVRVEGKNCFVDRYSGNWEANWSDRQEKYLRLNPEITEHLGGRI
jgi:phosphoribosylglycinamide formyltransferase-1